VNPSNDSEMKRRRMPIVCEGLPEEDDEESSPPAAELGFFLAPSPPPMNMATPVTIMRTFAYLRRGYRFPINVPMSMTGTGLQLLARTWMG
jgi:hypothetical protein